EPTCANHDADTARSMHGPRACSRHRRGFGPLRPGVLSHTHALVTLDGDYRGFQVATHDPGIAVITFNEPDRLNGISRGMKRDLTEIMTQAQLDTDTRVVVVTGSGRGFCAGDDIFNPTENDRHI